MKSWALVIVLTLLLVGRVADLWANPTQYGDTGLLTQPTAETLNAGNICIGLWGNHASGADGDSATIVPVAVTMGLGTFMEAYGSYPNLLFNDDEANSGRGFADIGFKIRALGKRSSPFKMAIDGQLRRAIADDPEMDGLTDYLGRLIVSYKPGAFGVHLNAGYLVNDSPAAADYDNQVGYGGGVEFFPAYRLRLIAEMAALTEKVKGGDGPREATLGFQYFLLPHLTLNLGVGAGFSDASPDWRALIGFSGCQGIGNYVTPIERVIEPAVEEPPVAKPATDKTIKLKTLTPLISMDAVKASPVARFELPVAAAEPEIVLSPEEKFSGAAPVETDALAVAPLQDQPSVEVSGAPQKPIRATVYRRFRLPEPAFDADQHSLSAEGEEALSRIAEELRNERKWLFIRIDGYTDSVGPERYNEEFSRQRAMTVAAHLARRDGIAPDRLFVKGFGERQPLASNDTPEGRGENRRVELLVLSPQELVE